MLLLTLERATSRAAAISSACMGRPTRNSSAWICATVRFTPQRQPISPQCRTKRRPGPPTMSPRLSGTARKVAFIDASLVLPYISVKTETTERTTMRMLVLGGSGFIGRQAAAALLERGHEVAIGTRFPERLERRLPQALRGCERREVHFERLLERDAWLVLLAGFDAVVNAVGILRERRGESYDRVHHLAPAALGAACALAGRRLVHVSALGLHATARSAFIRSKIAGEHGVASSGSDYCIVRPSLLDGPGGFGARWLRAMARLPVHFVPADARGKIAAMHVRDLGAAVALLCENERSRGVREAELGGVHLLTMAEYLAALRRRVSARPALVIPVPAWL